MHDVLPIYIHFCTYPCCCLVDSIPKPGGSMEVMISKYLLDITLVPISLCLAAGYHAYVYRSFRADRHRLATVGVNMMRRKWLETVVENNGTKGMLGVQSFRNSLMAAILSASVAIVLNTCLAAFGNNVFNAGGLLRQRPLLLGTHSGQLLALKYASASLLLLLSFLCSSAAVGCLVEANFLVNVPGEFFRWRAQAAGERGCLLAAVGSRMLLVTLCFLLWMFGPLPLALSTAALIWVFYQLDFAGGVGVRDSMVSGGL